MFPPLEQVLSRADARGWEQRDDGTNPWCTVPMDALGQFCSAPQEVFAAAAAAWHQLSLPFLLGQLCIPWHTVVTPSPIPITYRLPRAGAGAEDGVLPNDAVGLGRRQPGHHHAAGRGRHSLDPGWGTWN